MRRIAAAFGRKDKTQEHSPAPTAELTPPQALILPKRSGLFSRSTRHLDHIPANGLFVPGLATPTSSASSDASSTLRTPLEGDDVFATAQASPSRWKSFLRRNKSGTVAKPAPDVTAAESTVRQPQSRPAPGDSDDDTDDDESEAESDEYHEPTPTRPTVPLVVDPVFSMRAQTNLRTMLQNSLDSAPTSHPLLASLGSFAFPRSSNAASSLPVMPTMQSIMHCTKLLQRLDSRSLTINEQASILPFRSKHVQSRRGPKRIDDESESDHKKVARFSTGVQAWLRRPAFEERAVIWTLEPDVLGDVLRSKPVQGTGVAVAELEFSEGLLAISNADASIIYTRSQASRNAAGVSRRPSGGGMYRKVVLAQANARANAGNGKGREHEDNVPLGVVLKTKRDQVEKRRAAEEQKRREQEEKLRVLEEQKLRLAEEAERMVREEERRRKTYQDEVVAARLRRERDRQGSQARGNPFSPERLPAPRRTPSEPAPSSIPFDSRSEKSGRRTSSFAPRTRTDSTRSEQLPRPIPKSPSRTSVASQVEPSRHHRDDSRHTMSRADRRLSTMSDSSARSRDSRTLPRSFKPDAQFMPPPPLPHVARSSSTPQMPVFVPVFIPQPVTPSWGAEFAPIVAPMAPTSTMPYGQHPSLNPRMSMSADRLSMLVPPVSRTQIQ